MYNFMLGEILLLTEGMVGAMDFCPFGHYLTDS